VEINFKIVIAVGVSFGITILMLNFAMDYYSNNAYIYQLREKFYSNDFTNSENLVFVIGASHVGHLNATYIENYVSKSGSFEVYNLATGADKPSKRIEFLNKIISAKPALVVYGVGYRDFEDLTPPIVNKPQSILPDISDSIKNSFSSLLLQPEFTKFKSPKLVVLTTLRELTNLTSPEFLPANNSPFFLINTTARTITENETELIIHAERVYSSYYGIDSPEKNFDVLALKKIIKNLQENNIKIVIFTTPHHTVLSKIIPEVDRLLFEEILKELSDELDVKVYHLMDRYSKMDVWYTPAHIATNETVYSKDIAEIILKEFES